MLPFEHWGGEWRRENRFRSLALEVFLAILAVLVFPFILLWFVFWAIWYLAHPTPQAG